MLEIKYIKENKEIVVKRLSVRNIDVQGKIDKIIELDEQRKKTRMLLDGTLAKINEVSEIIGTLYKDGKTKEAEYKKADSIVYKRKAKRFEQSLKQVTEKLQATLTEIPNVPHVSVPSGKNDQDNEVVFEEGIFPDLEDNALPHWELAEKYDIIDFELGSKVTGAGFPFYKAKGARLQRGLINFFLDEAIQAGYIEYQPPLLVNSASGFGTGQLPDKDGQMYHVTEDNFYLIPTAEVPVTNIYRDVILKEGDFPIKNVAYSNCFRREAGSYGKDVRGLNRLHQFDKVEIVQIQHPENSYKTLEEMKDFVASLVRKLDLPFRILRLCGGDLGFAAAMTYDFEVYSAAQKRWLEVSSVSNFESFQARRMNLRFKDKDRKKHYAHTLNGSALALPRIVAALLENHQTPKGIVLPEVLRKYTGFDLID